ncbi:T9SS type A sorting domain-containing protein [Faecalibacter macacae]|uniref:T9SS C-terminal target domain-containing protein n=1 Tax=Faecalibacter macacae TaxID=1859289 RepID=A0A3L9M790_9FLAO|nr:T9SS type A sorting domain-containing protein [Faecalibacter macacae]RLZ07134.1 T9SS C-terminal target domain-containing protein [Faecalibacter macacae]
MKRKFLLLFTISSFIYAQDHQKYKFDDVLWEKSIGGENGEYLFDAIATPDYGFLLIGSSTSNASGDIQKNNQGGLDYFIWKMDENGKQEWQNSFGGNKDDILSTAILTKDGGYLLAGYSNSDLSGDKTEPNFGYSDYWIIKLNPKGEIQWQKSIGGLGNEYLNKIMQTSDGGFLVAGTSDSPKSSVKSVSANESLDYWVIKLDANGIIVWENSFGGNGIEEIIGVTEINDSYFILGNSNSETDIIREKIKYWQVSKLNDKGELVDQYNHYAEKEQQLDNIYVDQNLNEIILVGTQIKDEQREIFVSSINQDLILNKKFKQKIETANVIKDISLLDSTTFLISGNNVKYQNKNGNINAVSSFKSEIYNKNGEVIWSKIVSGGHYDFLSKAITTRDGSLVLIGNSDSNQSGNKFSSTNGGQDFLIVKLGDKTTTSSRQFIEAYPNPTADFTNVIINKDFVNATIEVFNLNGQFIKSQQVKYHTTPINLTNLPSGVYIVNVKYDGQSESIKVIKK